MEDYNIARPVLKENGDKIKTSGHYFRWESTINLTTGDAEEDKRKVNWNGYPYEFRREDFTDELTISEYSVDENGTATRTNSLIGKKELFESVNDDPPF